MRRRRSVPARVPWKFGVGRVGRWIVLTVALAMRAPAGCTGEDVVDPHLVSEFRQEAGKAYEAHLARFAEVEVECVSNETIYWPPESPQGGTEERKSRLQISRLAGVQGILISRSRDLTADESSEVIARNDRYWFRLGKSGDDANSTWYLRDGALVDLTASRQPPMYLVSTFLWYCEAGTRMWSIPLLETFDSSQFRLVEARRISRDESGAGSVRFGFEYTDAIRQGWLIPGSRYWAEINPDQGWLVEQSGLENQEDNTSLKMAIEYQSLDDGTRFPRLLRVRRGPLVEPSRKEGDEQTVEFEAPHPCTSPKAAFYLPYYGLSETALTGVRPARIGTRWILFAVGVVALVLAIWLRNRESKASGTR